jgi:DNA repair exonuclease SbcCD nuclease subunit
VSGIFDLAVKKAFKRICDAALKYKVDFIIISGDLFDEKQQSISANKYFFDQCQRLNKENIDLYVISGNHDSHWGVAQLFAPPDNVYLMSSEVVEVKEIKNKQGNKVAHIMGQSYRGSADSRKMYSSYIPPDEFSWNIGLLHSQLDPNNSRYVPCSYQDLSSKNDLHYWGLGHIHQPLILKKASPSIVYSGIPQGRDFGEPGVGGWVLVDLVPNETPNLKFIATATVVWKEVEINIAQGDDDLGNLEELKNKIKNIAENMIDHKLVINNDFASIEQGENNFAGYIVRWIITGRGKLHNTLQDRLEGVVDYLKESLRGQLQRGRPFIWTEDVEIRTAKPLPLLQNLKNNDSIFNEVEELTEMCLNNSKFQKQLLNQVGRIWEGEIDHEDYEEEHFQLTQDNLEKIVGLAKERIIEKILKERGKDLAD